MAVLVLSGATTASPGSVPSDELTISSTFADIYEANFDFVWRSLRRLGVPDYAVDDATQEVFIVAQRRLCEFEGRGSIKTWLFSIALRMSKRVRRSSGSHPSTELDEAIPDSSAMDPDDAASRIEEIQLVYRALDSLDDNRRAVFVLAELEQMPAPEISRALEVPLNTVYSRLRIARRQFESALRRQYNQATRIGGGIHGAPK